MICFMSGACIAHPERKARRHCRQIHSVATVSDDELASRDFWQVFLPAAVSYDTIMATNDQHPTCNYPAS
jgi:hypothetical protein